MPPPTCNEKGEARQITIILSFFLLSLLLISHCFFVKNKTLQNNFHSNVKYHVFTHTQYIAMMVLNKEWFNISGFKSRH